jgi:putative flippase GtrA
MVAVQPMTESGMIAKFARYVITGGTASVVDLLSFRLLLSIALPIWFAAIASWTIAAVVNYNLASRFVFRRSTSRKGGLQFLLGAVIGLCINAGVTLFLAQQVMFDPLTSKLIGIGSAFIFNFWINVLWVFK